MTHILMVQVNKTKTNLINLMWTETNRSNFVNEQVIRRGITNGGSKLLAIWEIEMGLR